MKIFFLFLILLCIGIADLQSATKNPHPPQQVHVLRLTHKQSGRAVLIERGMNVIIKLKQGGRVQGKIKDFTDEFIQIDHHNIHLDEIMSITYRNPKTIWLRILGGLGMFGGTTVSLLTLIVLPSLETNRLVWVVVLVFLLPALLLVFLGSLPFLRNTYNIRRRYKAEMIP
ncbi:MAG: hypothetical protein AAF587_18380 [Bacteroidota bacterium]